MKHIIENGKVKLILNEFEETYIKDIRNELLIELDHFAELEKEELITETEYFILPKIIIEQLERIKTNTIDNLAFNKHFYTEKCFYINDNGHVEITKDQNLFNFFVYSYHMIDDIDKGLRTAKGIISVCVINHLIKYSSEQDTPVSRDEMKYQYIFKPGGLKKFDYLRDNYPYGNSALTVKYTLIFEVLRSEIKKSFQEYTDFVKKDRCKEDFGKTLFNRAAQIDNNINAERIEKLKELLSCNFK